MIVVVGQRLEGKMQQVSSFSPVGNATATLTIASAVSIGSNLVEVRNKTMTIPQAVLNGLAKATAATVILKTTERRSFGSVLMAATMLAGAGFLIDSVMKQSKSEMCGTEE